MNHQALAKIRQIKQWYILSLFLHNACYAAAVAIVLTLVLNTAFGISFFYAAALFVVIFTGFVVNSRFWHTNEAAVAAFLDASYPELEESSALVLVATADLNLLQQLQARKVAIAMQEVPVIHSQFSKRLRLSGACLVVAFALILIAVKFNFHFANNYLNHTGQLSSAKSPVKEIILPEVESVSITITPPAYTRLKQHDQGKFTIETVEGAVISWKITTTIAVKNVSLLFNEHENLKLASTEKNKRSWVAQKAITKPGFYQVVIDGKRSDLYQVQVTKDLPPVIQIKAPKQYSYIDAGEKPVIAIQATVADDYGVSDAVIYATIAKGSGEAVKFKEQKINFPISFSKTLCSYDLQKNIDLPALGLEPGDEFYFYIQAKDNHAQQSRTDVYIVSIQDTAQLLSMDGILSGVNIKPEYFRSERQIILDAEALLKQKDTLTQDHFKIRSNDLGTDQKILRLRYGKFLGEEAEGNIADPRLEGNDKLADPKDFGNGAKILDEYTDKHDNAEDAQFFDPTVKAQLKATLTEMWKAELQLRLYKPQDALPFAYKALRLLKDLQQKSRSYVAKTAYNPSPLKMEKRLSGDLEKILQPTEHQDIKQPDSGFKNIKAAVAILQQASYGANFSGNDYQLLQAVNEMIGAKAAQQPAVYLSAASAMRRILAGNKKKLPVDIATVETAMQNMLPPAHMLPQRQSSAADMGLSKAYFLKLNRNR